MTHRLVSDTIKMAESQAQSHLRVPWGAPFDRSLPMRDQRSHPLRSHASFALASATVCHNMFDTASGPPQGYLTMYQAMRRLGVSRPGAPGASASAALLLTLQVLQLSQPHNSRRFLQFFLELKRVALKLDTNGGLRLKILGPQHSLSAFD
jgi:hypothetical protein